MHLFIIRHGQARSNLKDPSSCSYDPFFDPNESYDPSLTPLGEMQARMTGFRMRNFPITAIYAAPTHRTLSTAAAIASMQPGNLPIQVMPDLLERGSYHFKILPDEKLARVYNNFIPAGNPTVTGWSDELEPETRDMEWARAMRVKDYIMNKYTGNEYVVLVSSGGFMSEDLIAAFMGLSNEQAQGIVFGSDNACITKFDFRDGKIILNASNAVEQQGEAISLEYLEY